MPLTLALLIAASAAAEPRIDECPDRQRPATFDKASAMLAVFCAYDSEHGGTPLPVEHTEDWAMDEAETVASPIIAITYREGAVEKAVLAVQRQSIFYGEVSNAHAQTAVVSIYVFQRSGGRWVIEKRAEEVLDEGHNGESPGAQLVKLGAASPTAARTRSSRTAIASASGTRQCAWSRKQGNTTIRATRSAARTRLSPAPRPSLVLASGAARGRRPDAPRLPRAESSSGTSTLVIMVRSWLLPLTVACAVGSAAIFAAAPATLLPIDAAAEQPDFFSFRAQLQAAVARHDVGAVMAVLDPNIKLSFGGDDGLDGFRRLWRPTEADSELWGELGAVLALGGTFDTDSSFTAPYIFSKWPNEFDGLEHVALTGSNVRIRSAAKADAPAIATLSFAILPLARINGRADFDGWTAVQLDGKKTGYVVSRLARGPVDYRARFNKTSGRWLMTFFLAGD